MLTAVCVLGTGTAAAGAAPAEAQAESRRIAEATLGQDLRVIVTATRSTRDRYAASVDLAVHRFSGGAWHQTSRIRVGQADGWFWYSLTGSTPVCEFSVKDYPRRPGQPHDDHTVDPTPQRITLSLGVTPSIGCSPVHRYHLDGDRVVAD